MRKRPALLALALLVVALPGCASEEGKPEGREERRLLPPARAGTSPRGTAAPALLTIADVRARARSSSERVLEARALVRKAQAHQSATFDEVFLPKVDAESNTLVTDRRLAIETSLGPIQVATRELSTDVVRASQPLLDVAGFFFRVGAERDAAEIARLSAERVADLAELEAIQSFYLVLTRRQEGLALERSVELLKRRVEDARSMRAAERARPNDVTRIELELSRREQALLATRHREREASLALHQLLAIPSDAPLEVTEPADPRKDAAEPPLEKAVAMAGQRRADLRALLVADRRLEALESAALADYAPHVEGFADYRYDYNRVLNDPDAVEAGIQVKWRIFDGFARNERRAEASAEREAVRARRRDLERRVAIEVERALLAIDEERSAVSVGVSAVKQAEDSLGIEEKLFRSQRSTVSDLLQAELKLLESRVEVARARYAHLEAKEALRTAIGGEAP